MPPYFKQDILTALPCRILMAPSLSAALQSLKKLSFFGMPLSLSNIKHKGEKKKWPLWHSLHFGRLNVIVV